MSWICFHLLLAVNELVCKDFPMWLWGLLKGKKPLLSIPREKRISQPRFQKKMPPPPPSAAAAKAGRNNFLSKIKKTTSLHTTIGEQYSQTISIIW
jgi:hypothetical protein